MSGVNIGQGGNVRSFGQDNAVRREAPARDARTGAPIARLFRGATGLDLAGEVGGPEREPTVILLHGGGQTRHSWAGAMRRLIDVGYRVISYDARGHGDSDWDEDGDYSIASLAADLRSILAKVSRPRALVGASMGGNTAFHALSEDIGLADALVLVDIVPRPSGAGVERIRRFMTAHPDGFADVAEAADAVAAYNPDRARPSDPSGLLRNLRRRENGRLYWHWDPRLMSARPSSEPPYISDEILAAGKRIRVPTLLVRGGHSDIVDDEGIEQLRSLLPQTEVHDVAGAGHMVAGDRNDAFNQGIVSFLQRHMPLHQIP